MLEHREKSSNEKLAELDGKMEAVVGWAKAGYVDFSKFDFTPLPCHNQFLSWCLDSCFCSSFQ